MPKTGAQCQKGWSCNTSPRLDAITKKGFEDFSSKPYQQGYKDSNLEMTESESVALPFGDIPISVSLVSDLIIISKRTRIVNTFFKFFLHFKQ